MNPMELFVPEVAFYTLLITSASITEYSILVRIMLVRNSIRTIINWKSSLLSNKLLEKLSSFKVIYSSRTSTAFALCSFLSSSSSKYFSSKLYSNLPP